MLFVTLGSQKFQFNRLLKKIDELIEENIICEEVYAQIGSSDYKPRYFKYKNFLNQDEYIKMIKQSEIVITHAGTGAIIGALREQKKVIAIPRLSIYKESVDNHQIQIINQFKKLNLIYGCSNCEELGYAIINIKKIKYDSFKSNTKELVYTIDKYISNIEK